MVQVFFVMLFFPVVMNALQYYIIDSFIKDQKTSDHDPIPSEDEEEDGLDEHREPCSPAPSDVDHTTIQEVTKDGTKVRLHAEEDKPKRRASPNKARMRDRGSDGEGSDSSVEANGMVSPFKDIERGS